MLQVGKFGVININKTKMMVIAKDKQQINIHRNKWNGNRTGEMT